MNRSAVGHQAKATLMLSSLLILAVRDICDRDYYQFPVPPLVTFEISAFRAALSQAVRISVLVIATGDRPDHFPQTVLRSEPLTLDLDILVGEAVCSSSVLTVAARRRIGAATKTLE